MALFLIEHETSAQYLYREIYIISPHIYQYVKNIQ